jgi:hypothetical protein
LVKVLCRFGQSVFAATGKTLLPPAAKHLCRLRQNVFAGCGKNTVTVRYGSATGRNNPGIRYRM